MGKNSRLGRIKGLLAEGKTTDEIVEVIKAKFPDAKSTVVRGQIYSAKKGKTVKETATTEGVEKPAEGTTTAPTTGV